MPTSGIKTLLTLRNNKKAVIGIKNKMPTSGIKTEQIESTRKELDKY